VNSWSPWEALKREPLQTQYTQAFYWALIVTTGVGRDVIPQSDLEASYVTAAPPPLLLLLLLLRY
jgi:hypothetical protein